MPVSFSIANALVNGILASDNKTKQELGRRFAFLLGFEPGPRGPDDGIDGVLVRPAQKIHFQCKLKKEPLDVDEARKYYSDIQFHQATGSIMLAGRGYKPTFVSRLFGHHDIDRVSIHLLTLGDIISETPVYQAALAAFPDLKHLSQVDWRAYA